MDSLRRRQGDADWSSSSDRDPFSQRSASLQQQQEQQAARRDAGKRSVYTSVRDFSDVPMPEPDPDQRPLLASKGGWILTAGLLGVVYLFLVTPEWTSLTAMETSSILAYVCGWALFMLLAVLGVCIVTANRPAPVDYSHLSLKQQKLLGLPLTTYKPPAATEEVTRAYPSPALAMVRSQSTSRSSATTAAFRPLMQRELSEVSPVVPLRSAFGRTDGIADESALRRYAQHYERKYQSPQTESGHFGGLGASSPYRSSFLSSPPLAGNVTSPLAAWPPSPGLRPPSAGGSSSGTLPLSATRTAIPYTPSYREEPDKNQEGLTESVPLEDEKADTYIAHEAAKLLARLGIADQFSGWIQNLRFWVSAVVIRPVAVALEQSDQYLVQLAAQELKSNSTLPMETRAMLSTSPPNMLQLTLYFAQRYPNAPVVQNRATLEKYLEVSGVSHKGYVRQRLKALSQTENLGDYRWNSGGDWNGQAWKGHLPTDAQIVVHAFNTHMDRIIPQFSRDCFTEYSANQAARKKKAVEIVQIRFAPPYFALFHNKGRWLAEPGRHNLLATLVLFFYYIREHAHGRIGQVALSDGALNYVDQIFSEEI